MSAAERCGRKLARDSRELVTTAKTSHAQCHRAPIDLARSRRPSSPSPIARAAVARILPSVDPPSERASTSAAHSNSLDDGEHEGAACQPPTRGEMTRQGPWRPPIITGTV